MDKLGYIKCFLQIFIYLSISDVGEISEYEILYTV